MCQGFNISVVIWNLMLLKNSDYRSVDLYRLNVLDELLDYGFTLSPLSILIVGNFDNLESDKIT